MLRIMEKKKIVIACDSYKGCLTSKEVNFQLGVRSEELGVNADIVTLEMSDGGDGMLDAFLSAMGGERVAMHAHDALMRWIDAEYGIANDTAIIEIANYGWLGSNRTEQRNPMKATSWGVANRLCMLIAGESVTSSWAWEAVLHLIAALVCSRRWVMTGRRFAKIVALSWLRM